MEGGQVVGLRTMARMRSEVCESEVKNSELNWLMAALEQRFSALSSRQG